MNSGVILLKSYLISGTYLLSCWSCIPYLWPVLHPIEVAYYKCGLSPILLPYFIFVTCPPSRWSHISYLWTILHHVEFTYHTCELSSTLLKSHIIPVNCLPSCWSYISYLWPVLHSIEVTYHLFELSFILLKPHIIYVTWPHLICPVCNLYWDVKIPIISHYPTRKQNMTFALSCIKILVNFFK